MSTRIETMAEETPRNLISATETLLVEKGHAGVTLRDITDLAGANVAAVAYHFGSKDDLVAKVYGDALAEVTSVQRQAIEAPRTGNSSVDNGRKRASNVGYFCV